MPKTSLSPDPADGKAGAEKKRKKGLFSIGPIQATVIGTIILHLLGFKFAEQLIDNVMQGARTAGDVASMIWKKAQGRFFLLLALVTVCGMFMYVFHGGFYVAIFGIASLLLVMYCMLLVFAVLLLASLKAGGAFAKQGVATIGELFQHILYWDVAVMAAFLLYEPWNHEPETFALFALSQIALFIVNDTWRYRVRAASVLVLACVGLFTFAHLTYGHLPAPVQKIIDGGVRGVELAGNIATSFSSLGPVGQLLDVDLSDKVDSVDADIIQNDLAFRMDNNHLMMKIGGAWYLKGDYDGDGKVDSIDAVLLRGFLAKPPKNAAPMPMETRVPNATQYGMHQPASPQEPAGEPIVPQRQQLQPVQQPSTTDQYASVVPDDESVSQVADAVPTNVQTDDLGEGSYMPSSEQVMVFEKEFPDTLWLDSTEGLRIGVTEIVSFAQGTDVKFVWVVPPGMKNAHERIVACVKKFTYLRSTDPDTCYRILEYVTGLKPKQAKQLNPGDSYEAVIRFEPLQPGIRWLMVCLWDFDNRRYPSGYFAVV
ncbi:MAG: dockerin type I repeat-containing protein [Patescibacteria group bacterium]|nr:dockerin type I repeat-containing protein [Patescibacteria group bacterium]MDD5715689.1 dockerin type I repeat-containing protein [Patescibacteria group bacterium]